MHAALGAAAAAQAQNAGGPGLSPRDDDEYDAATLAAARNAHRAMCDAASAPAPVGAVYNGTTAATTTAAPAPAAVPMPPPPSHPAPGPPVSEQPHSAPESSAGGVPQSLDDSEISGGMSGGSRRNLLTSQKRRSFGSLAAHFSARSPGTQNMLSPDLMDQPPGSHPPTASNLPITPGSGGSCSGGHGPPDGFHSRPAGLEAAMGLSSAGGTSVKDFGGISESGNSGVPRPTSRQGSFAQLSRLGSRSSLSVSFEKRNRSIARRML